MGFFLATPVSASRRSDQRQFNETGLARLMVDALLGLSKIFWLGPEDIGHECLRVAVVERKPTRLYLHHDLVSRQENVVRRRQGEFVEQRFVGRDRLRSFKALAIAPA